MKDMNTHIKDDVRIPVIESPKGLRRPQFNLKLLDAPDLETLLLPSTLPCRFLVAAVLSNVFLELDAQVNELSKLYEQIR